MARQFIVNAFVDGLFSGNGAAVVPLEAPLSDQQMQSIAAQNNLSETAYFVPGPGPINLRWFTPTVEIELCGHATLASAHVLFEELGDQREVLEFETLSGKLRVRRDGDGYSMDLPAAAPASEGVDDALRAATLASVGADAGEVLLAGWRPFAVLESGEFVRRIEPDLEAIAALPGGDLIVSAPGVDGKDVTVRVFGPGVGIPEDPATGSAQCSVAPYWCERLGKSRITTLQASARGGHLAAEWESGSDRVAVIGRCQTFSRGEISV